MRFSVRFSAKEVRISASEYDLVQTSNANADDAITKKVKKINIKVTQKLLKITNESNKRRGRIFGTTASLRPRKHKKNWEEFSEKYLNSVG